MQVTPAIQEYAQNKISHAVEPYQQVIKTVDVRVYARGGDTGTKGSKCAPDADVSMQWRTFAHSCGTAWPAALIHGNARILMFPIVSGNCAQPFSTGDVRGDAHFPVRRQQTIELTIRTARLGVVRAQQTNDDLYAAIDLSCDKVARSLRKLKEKAMNKGNWHGHAGKGAPKMADMAAEASEDDGAYVPSDDEVESATRKLSDLPSDVKKTKVFYLDPMSVEVRAVCRPPLPLDRACCPGLGRRWPQQA